MSTKLLVVVGITGQQGGSVAKLYAQEAGWKVRGITRHVDKAQACFTKGVDIMKADLNDKESLVAAFRGADAIFSNTDFWGSFYDPATQKKLKSGQSINEYCFEQEVQQGKNIAEAAATVQGLARFIISSLSDATESSKGEYTWVCHFDSKARIVDHIRKEYPSLSAKMSVVQAGAYMSNWKQMSPPTKQIDGSYRLAAIGSGKTPIPHFDSVRDTGYLVRAALQTAPGKNILGAGSMLSWSDYLKTWCQVNKVPFGGYDEIPSEAFEKHITVPGLGKELAEMFLYFDDFGYTGGGSNVVQAEDLHVPCPLTTWEDYIKAEHVWSNIL